MSKFPDTQIDGQWILSKRGGKNPVDPLKPYGYFIEKERTVSGAIENVSTILLTNSECPFRCLMCDLWKNTTDEPIPEGSIPAQIEFALSKLPVTKHLKLYNSGSFFDNRAIPANDYGKIASLVNHFETVIVESHPGFINENCLLFQHLIKPELHVAIGLETVHPEVLPRLNKKMDLADFERSVRFLAHHGISSRAFILLRPPFLSEPEGVLWAKKSIDYAFGTGVSSATIIPVRSGNGALDALTAGNYFEQPGIKSLENVIEYGIRMNAGPVFADLWDIDIFSSCNNCLVMRKKRLTQMNLHQEIPPRVNCSCTL
ncbi:MAG: radical SAM protein [Chlorobi bacterium]|nr:radical SAM protein [Chlorobiota bacterium]